MKPASARGALLLIGVVASTACATPSSKGSRTQPSSAVACAAPLGVSLVESWPLETSLDHADIPDAKDVWVAMIDSARTSLDIAQFYMSDDPAAKPDRPSALGSVVAAVKRAGVRGVRVRVLVEEGFYAKYPELPDVLAKEKGISVRRIDGKKAFGGGILHAKYFVVDDREAYLGSQNFDYRSLSHIHELGVRSADAHVVRSLGATFDRDFRVAGDEPSMAPSVVPRAGGQVTFAASPKDLLPEGVAWDLPLLVERIRGAKREILVQVLGYKTALRDGTTFDVLDRELRAAAARGVSVTLQVGHWHGKEPSLLALRGAGIRVRIVQVADHSSGQIPFARVIHAKYMVVDRARSWIGTSNWEGDYFLKSRNVGVFVEDAAFAERLAAVFADVGQRLPEAP
jgi:phosphatidylserine/phosphatidylglycerophosphate/cardiolipin synthase-like enzyme